MRFIVRNRLTGTGCTAVWCRVNRFQFFVIIQIIAITFVVAVQTVTSISDTQFKIYGFFTQLFVQHRRFHYGGEKEEFFGFRVGRFRDGKCWLQFNWNVLLLITSFDESASYSLSKFLTIFFRVHINIIGDFRSDCNQQSRSINNKIVFRVNCFSFKLTRQWIKHNNSTVDIYVHL